MSHDRIELSRYDHGHLQHEAGRIHTKPSLSIKKIAKMSTEKTSKIDEASQWSQTGNHRLQSPVVSSISPGYARLQPMSLPMDIV